MSDRKDHIKVLKQFLKDYQEWGESLELEESVKFAINSLEVDEAYQLEYETCKKDIRHNSDESELNKAKDEFKMSDTGLNLNDIMKDKKIPKFITFDELKEIREEIGGLQTYKLFSGDTELYLSKDDALDVLDKRISELEK